MEHGGRKRRRKCTNLQPQSMLKALLFEFIRIVLMLLPFVFLADQCVFVFFSIEALLFRCVLQFDSHIKMQAFAALPRGEVGISLQQAASKNLNWEPVSCSFGVWQTAWRDYLQKACFGSPGKWISLKVGAFKITGRWEVRIDFPAPLFCPKKYRATILELG